MRQKSHALDGGRTASLHAASNFVMTIWPSKAICTALPHVARNTARAGGSAIDARTTRHSGYAFSQKKRKRIEECFGWMKDIALLRKLKHRGLFKVGWIFSFAAAAYNLVRMRNMIPIATAA